MVGGDLFDGRSWNVVGRYGIAEIAACVEISDMEEIFWKDVGVMWKMDELFSQSSPGVDPIYSTKLCGWQGNGPEEAGNQHFQQLAGTRKSQQGL